MVQFRIPIGPPAPDVTQRQLTRQLKVLLNRVQQKLASSESALLIDLKLMARQDRATLGEYTAKAYEGRLEQRLDAQLRAGDADSRHMAHLLKGLVQDQAQSHTSKLADSSFYEALDGSQKELMALKGRNDAGDVDAKELGQSVLKTLIDRAQKLGKSVWTGDAAAAQAAMLKAGLLNGKQLQMLSTMGINHPSQLLAMAKTAEGRALLAKHFGLSRGQLLSKLLRTELLRIPQGQKGELGIDGSIARGLQNMGVHSLRHLSVMRALPHDELKDVTRRLRALLGDPDSDSRLLVPRDVRHWGQEAGRMRSLLELDASLELGNVEEQVAKWFMDQTFFSELAFTAGRTGSPREKLLALWADQIEHYGWSREREASEREHLEYLEDLAYEHEVKERDREREIEDWLKKEREREQREKERREQEEREEEELEELLEEEALEESIALRHDADEKGLICYWVSEPMWPDELGRHGIKHLYVCLDPRSGNLVPKASRIEYLPDNHAKGILALKSSESP